MTYEGMTAEEWAAIARGNGAALAEIAEALGGVDDHEILDAIETLKAKAEERTPRRVLDLEDEVGLNWPSNPPDLVFRTEEWPLGETLSDEECRALFPSKVAK